MEEREKDYGTFTIEKQLRHYQEKYKENERYEILWHAWKHNKRWLCRMMEWIMPTYQHYSKHDETHALAILHNIEMLLGRDQIARLSASDCFLILHVVYLHDIGMCITHEDREKLMENKNFIDFLKQTSQTGNDVMRKYAELLLRYCHEMPKQDPAEENRSEALKIKLDVYYAVIYLVSEYSRKEHAKSADQRLNDWIDKPDKLGIGFSTSGIPSRFFYNIGACAGIHTSYDFNDVLKKLPQEDGGYAHDFMHPRFAAVLLQLGDALDLDNDRFHPLVEEFLGDLPHVSEIHLGKHKSIRRLRINPDKITIEADCPNSEVLRQVSVECECIRDILKNATFHWSAICPKELTASLPNFEPEILRLNGKDIQTNIVNAKFEIQQEKAFNMLQGMNIYANNNFVFLRELLQNAVDTSKIQYWKDWQGSRWYNKDAKSIQDLGKGLSPLSYPIEIELYLAVKKKYENDYERLDTREKFNLLQSDERYKEYQDKNNVEYGVLVRVVDYGTGITARDLTKISMVGSGHETSDDMPSWLVPTAEFGIGLQSVFLVADSFRAYTNPRTEEKYKIEFTATGSKGHGYINVTPLEDQDVPKRFGTIFEVFVPSDKRVAHQKDIRSWSGRDPFDDPGLVNEQLLHSRELLVQLAFYVDSLVEVKLFPVYLKTYDFNDNETDGQEKKNHDEKGIVETKLTSGLHHVLYEAYFERKMNAQAENPSDALEQKRKRELSSVAWSYNLPDMRNGDFIYGSVDEIYQYAFDCENAKLLIWNSNINVYARFGSDRIQAMRKLQKDSDVDKTRLDTKIYYKGIYTKSVSWDKDVNLLEYIDIKGKLKPEHLAVNRGDFTEEGEKYIHQEIYPGVLEAAHKVLNLCDKDEKIYRKIREKFEQVIEETGEESRGKEREKIENIRAFVLSVVSLATFAQLRSNNDFPVVGDKARYENWNKLLSEMSERIVDVRKAVGKRLRGRDESWVDSTFFRLDVCKLTWVETGRPDKKDGTDEKGGAYKLEMVSQDIADIMNCNNHYAIISRRNSKTSTWEEYLLWLAPRNPGDEGFREWVMELKMQWDGKERQKIINTIEKRSRPLIDQANDIFKETVQGDRTTILNQNLILNWMLKNIPTIALFSTMDATIRLNVLDLRYTDSIYFDANTKWSIYERMYEIYKKDHIMRFSSYATTGYCQLATNDDHQDVYFVKRGKLASIGLRYMVMPFCGDALKELFVEDDTVDIDIQDNEIHNLWRCFIGLECYVRDQFRAKEERKEAEKKAKEESGRETVEKPEEKTGQETGEKLKDGAGQESVEKPEDGTEQMAGGKDKEKDRENEEATANSVNELMDEFLNKLGKFALNNELKGWLEIAEKMKLRKSDGIESVCLLEYVLKAVFAYLEYKGDLEGTDENIYTDAAEEELKKFSETLIKKWPETIDEFREEADRTKLKNPEFRKWLEEAYDWEIDRIGHEEVEEIVNGLDEKNRKETKETGQQSKEITSEEMRRHSEQVKRLRVYADCQNALRFFIYSVFPDLIPELRDDGEEPFVQERNFIRQLCDVFSPGEQEESEAQFASAFKYLQGQKDQELSDCVESWMKRFVIPRYVFSYGGDRIQKVLDVKREMLAEKLKKVCGLSGQSGGSDPGSLKKLIKYLDDCGWVKLNDEQYRRLYTYYIDDMADVFLKVQSGKLKKIQGEYVTMRTFQK